MFVKSISTLEESNANIMSKLIKLFLLLTLLNQSTIIAQETNWIDDSLSFYRQKVESAIVAKDFDEVIELNKLIANQGYVSLNPKVYNYFYEQSSIRAYEDQPNVLARVYHNIGNFEFYRSNFNAAKSGFNKALELYRQSENIKSAAGMAMNLAILLEKGGKFDSAIINYKKALPIFEELKDTSSITLVLENISIAHRLKGSYDSAIFYINAVDSTLLLNTPKNSQRWVTFYYNKGSIYRSMSAFDKSLKFFLEGISLSEKLENSRLANNGYVYIVDLYTSLKDTINVKKYIRLGRDFAEKINDTTLMAGFDFDLGELYIDQAILDSAIQYIDQGLKLAKTINASELLREGYILLGSVKYQQRDFRETVNLLELVVSEYPSPRKKTMSGIYQSLGSAYMEIGDYKKSSAYLKKSLILAKELNVWDRLLDTYRALSSISAKQGDYKNAYEYFALAKAYEDSIFTEAKSKQFAELQTEYETEKKDQSIASLEKEKRNSNLTSLPAAKSDLSELSRLCY